MAVPMRTKPTVGVQHPIGWVDPNNPTHAIPASVVTHGMARIVKPLIPAAVAGALGYRWGIRGSAAAVATVLSVEMLFGNFEQPTYMGPWDQSKLEDRWRIQEGYGFHREHDVTHKEKFPPIVDVSNDTVDVPDDLTR